jgi:hypothetical protein
MAAPVREKARSPIEGMERAAVEYKEELDTATDAEFQRGRERYRFQLRQYLWQYVPRLLRRHRGELEQPGGVEKFLSKYGGKGHPALKRRTLLKYNPKRRTDR